MYSTFPNNESDLHNQDVSGCLDWPGYLINEESKCDSMAQRYLNEIQLTLQLAYVRRRKIQSSRLLRGQAHIQSAAYTVAGVWTEAEACVVVS